ncbi:MAG: VTT domain-containing protein, partial [Desulfurococcaceae archaeon]
MLIKELGGLGYLGLLLIAFVSNAVPFSTIPYLVFLAPILAKQHGMEQIYAILVLALGASLGKLIVYVIARSISKIGRVSRSIHNLVNFTHMFKKATFLTVFLVAALPIPDDVFYIPIGISKYNIPLFFVALLLGKIVVTA